MTRYISLKIKVISFILIIFVVILHSYNFKKNIPEDLAIPNGFSGYVQDLLSFGITRVAVPLFFLISGYLYYNNFSMTYTVIKSKFHKRIFSLIIPYLLWSIIIFIFYYVLQSIPRLSHLFNNQQLVTKLNITEVISKIIIHPIPYQLWFVNNLVILVLISPIIYLLIKHAGVFFIVILATAWFNNYGLVIISNEAALFFAIGGYLNINKVNLSYSWLENSAYYISVTWLIVLIIKLILITKGKLSYQENMYLNKISIVIGIFSIWSLYDRLVSESKAKKIGIYQVINFTFFIYLTHEPILTIYKKILLRILGESELASLAIYLSAACLTILTSTLLAYVSSKHIPKIYNILTGNRSKL